MKPRLWLSLVIFISAYAPLSLLFCIRDFDAQTLWFKHPFFVYSSLVMAIVSVAFLFVAMGSIRGQFPVTIKQLSLRSNDLVNYSIPYLVSFFGVDFGKWQDVTALTLFMALLFLLTLKTQSIFINPILALLGWGLYEVEFEESNKTKKGVFLAIIELKAGERYKMERVSQFLYAVSEHLNSEG